jgi:hypothetical protein
MPGIVASKGNGKPPLTRQTPVYLPEVNLIDPCSGYGGLEQILCQVFQNWQSPCSSFPPFAINNNACMNNSYLDIDSNQYVTFEPTAGNNPLGVNLASTSATSCTEKLGPVNSLPGPFGGLITNVEFIYSSPPVNDCSSYPKGPADCAKCPSGYCEPYGMSCAANYFPVKVGPCIKTRDGGSIQGWQCIPATYDLNTGNCQSCDLNPNGLGQYASLQACQNAITTNPCSGNGTCSSGNCTCNPGYAKPDCSLQCPSKGGHCCSSSCLGDNCQWPDQESAQWCGSRGDSYCCDTYYGWTCCEN